MFTSPFSSYSSYILIHLPILSNPSFVLLHQAFKADTAYKDHRSNKGNEINVCKKRKAALGSNAMINGIKQKTGKKTYDKIANFYRSAGCLMIYTAQYDQIKKTRNYQIIRYAFQKHQHMSQAQKKAKAQQSNREIQHDITSILLWIILIFIYDI